MSGLKGWPSSDKLQDNKSPTTITQNEYVTVQPTGGKRHALDTVARFAFRVGTIEATEAGTTDLSIVATGHLAIVGDIVRFEAAGANQYLEIPIVRVEPNVIYLGMKIPVVPTVGDQFWILRYVTQRTDSSGEQLVTISPSPIAFVLDSVDTEVEEDTVTPANSRPLPVKPLDDSGNTILPKSVFSLDGTPTDVLEDTGTPANSRPLPVKILNPAGIPIVHPTFGAVVNTEYHDYSVGNVTNAAWTELIASTSAQVYGFTLFDSGGYTMELGIGAAASEVRLCLVPPGGFDGVTPIEIAAGTRISVRAVGIALVNVGEIALNLLG